MRTHRDAPIPIDLLWDKTPQIPKKRDIHLVRRRCTIAVPREKVLHFSGDSASVDGKGNIKVRLEATSKA
jgi:hypothetical protein